MLNCGQLLSYHRDEEEGKELYIFYIILGQKRNHCRC